MAGGCDSFVDNLRIPMIWLHNLLLKEGMMRKIFIAIVVSVIVLAAFHLAGAEEDLFDTAAATAHIDKGMTDLKNKDYDSAIKELEEAVSIDPDAEAYYYLGYAYYMKGKTGDEASRKKSLEAFEKVYELDPSFTPSGPSLTETPPSVSSESTETEAAPGVSSVSVKPEPSAISSEPTETDATPEGSPEPTDSKPMPEKQPEQLKSENGAPSQPSIPFKATDKVSHIGAE
jgi:tetratricopeptide (TPR) repeat protein